ncbi:hypothetical protein [Actinomadura atramentaria]|uniref:hypothetical protein n=1 Tax=Actinomadura atramentaria TaxID=1990 RepID=UPI000373B9B0|nr:hypothetical protein [Actinomadura atramentaria]
MTGATEPGFDPSVLDAAQRHGDACVVCRKRWPRPRVRVGHVPGGGGVFACAECAALLPVPAPATPAGERPARQRPAWAAAGD